MSDLPPFAENAPVEEFQTQPHSREAEESVLGSVLINPEAYLDIAQFLKPDDFYIVRNRWVWEAYMRLSEKRIPIDNITICNELQQKDQLSEVGGPAYITFLISQVPTSLNATAYGHIVEEKSIRRRMLTAANDMA
jgi:replicative DNA helicase